VDDFPGEEAVPLMDPTLFVASISATLQAIQTWLQYRDSRRTLGVFEDRLKDAPQHALIQNQARYLSKIIPQPILDTMGERAQKCWEQYHEVLKGGFLPGEIDEATENVKECLCRELRRILRLNGGIMPPGVLSDWWLAYCAHK
jgi:hypothetical protein